MMVLNDNAIVAGSFCKIGGPSDAERSIGREPPFSRPREAVDEIARAKDAVVELALQLAWKLAGKFPQLANLVLSSLLELPLKLAIVFALHLLQSAVDLVAIRLDERRLLASHLLTFAVTSDWLHVLSVTSSATQFHRYRLAPNIERWKWRLFRFCHELVGMMMLSLLLRNRLECREKIVVWS